MRDDRLEQFQPSQLMRASSSSSPLVIGTLTAKELMHSQILYSDPSIWGCFRIDLNFNYNHGIRGPSPGLDLNNWSWKQIPVSSNYHLATVSAPPHQINDMGVEFARDDGDDGRIRSLPHKKNGPYTCSKCKQEFPTSQQFAAHVVSKHYKHENKSQRNKRLMSKFRHMKPRIGKVNGQITCHPDSSSGAQDEAGNSFAQRYDGGKQPIATKVEVDEEVGL